VAAAAVIASEDATFRRNRGVDWGALHQVLSGAEGPTRGASTITMQTAKNLFLWPGSSVLRRGVEIPMALVLGQVCSKARTLEIYLNIAEWGDGLFGLEAEAQHIFTRRRAGSTRARRRCWRPRCPTRSGATPRIQAPCSAASPPPSWRGPRIGSNC
jgi:membrane carboxypeptidase/penicillin-binding protein PbpC